jgi:hypothetical protein
MKFLIAAMFALSLAAADASKPKPPEITAQAKLDLLRIDKEVMRLQNLKLQIDAAMPQLESARQQKIEEMRKICGPDAELKNEAQDPTCVAKIGEKK